jgi:hypothetical protein
MHSQIPPGWTVDLDADGHVRFSRTHPTDEPEQDSHSLLTECVFLAVVTAGLFALSCVVLSLYGISPAEIPALLGIPT